jgi:type IV pilus assembly protein PilW
VVAGTDNEGGGTSVLDGTDTVTVSFEGDDVMTHCLGGVVAAGAVSTNTYRVTDGRVLQCVAATTTAAGAAIATQPLADDVDNMQILYGEDSNSDGSVDRYVNATAVGNFDDVLSVHMALLLASAGDVKPAATNATYNLVGTNVTMPRTGQDRIQRRVVERVVSLRNRLR